MFELVSRQGPRFVVQLLPCEEGVTVRATGPDGQQAEVHTHLQRIDDVLRMASQPAFHEDIGRGLFRALFFGAMEELYRAVYTQAARDGVPLTLELHLAHDVLRLGRYPWELMHDGTRFLVQTGTVNLVRTLDFPEAVPAYQPRGPLDILVAAAQLDGQPVLTSMYDELDEALTDRIQADELDLAALFPPTWDSLMDWLLAGAPDVLHFEGYGDFTRTGRLFFWGERGGDPVDAAALGAAFFSTRLRLIALSASSDYANGDESLLGSIAPTLIAAGIPAAVAVQRTLPHDVAAQFWSAFYDALLSGDDIEYAMGVARQQLRRTMYWHAIALYRRATPVPQIDHAPVPVRLDTAAPDQVTVGWTVRAALWVKHQDAILPEPYIVYRLIGVDPPPEENDLALRMQPGGKGPVTLHTGSITVRLTAPGCVVHNPAQHTRLFNPEAETQPLWFALTPRQPGHVSLTFELLQGDRVVGTVHHPLHVVAEAPDGSAGEGVAVVYTQGTSQPTSTRTRPPQTVDPQESRESAFEYSRGRDVSPDAARRESGRAPLPEEHVPIVSPFTLLEEAVFNEALDGVADSLQTGLPPDDDADPMIRNRGATVRRVPDQEAERVAVPESPSIHDEPTQIDSLAALQKPTPVKKERGWSLPPSEAERALFTPPFDPPIQEITTGVEIPPRPGPAQNRSPIAMLILLITVIVVVMIILGLIVL